jgi:hypothetical protein
MGENEDKIDYLEVDDQISGQNYVCLSFVSPETMIDSKEAFKVSKFLQSVCKDKDMDFKKTMEQYKDFTYKFSEDLQKDFDEQNDFKTNIRGLKVRGTYNTKDEAERRAKKLQGLDSDFHVFVGQVGYWLPWDPNADKIEDESFINSQLNDMMEKYKENTLDKDIFYEEQKRDKVKAAREEVIRKKKEQVAQEKLENVSDEEGKDVDGKDVDGKDVDGKEVDGKDVDGKEVEEPEEEVEVIKEVIGDTKEKCEECPEPEPEPECCKDTFSEPEPELKTDPKLEGGKLDEDLTKSLNDVDPWMANKLKDA